MTNLYLFDCDETLWTSPTKDYVSRGGDVVLELAKPRIIVRQPDGTRFTLRPQVVDIFQKLQSNGHSIGIVSDNTPAIVTQALRLFRLEKYIDPSAVNVKLWDGYCPKHDMVTEILTRGPFTHIAPKNVYWLDDKDYSNESQSIGVNFVRVKKDDDLLRATQ